MELRCCRNYSNHVTGNGDKKSIRLLAVDKKSSQGFLITLSFFLLAQAEKTRGPEDFKSTPKPKLVQTQNILGN